MRRVNQRFVERGFVCKIIIERRLRDARRVHDGLHGRAGITAMRKLLERRVENFLPCGQIRFVHKPTER